MNPADKPLRRWLPDFCDPLRVFVVFVVTEMLVFIYALSFLGEEQAFLTRFSVTSLFAQLIALNLILVLCRFRSLFNRLPVWQGVIAYSVLLIVTAWLYARLALWLNESLQTPFGPEPAQHHWFVLRSVLITWLAGLALLRYFFVQRQWQKKTRQHAEARFMALQSRIKPHFLFNSMNSIASLIAIDPAKAEKAVENLAALFRRALQDDPEQTVTLAQELEWTDKYLGMEKMRLGQRLQCQIQVDPSVLDARLPALCLQPLVENAVVHGIQPRSEGGKIHLQARPEEQQLVIEISNPLPATGNGPRTQRHNGMALTNIRERLQLLYGHRASLLTRASDQLFTACLRVPLEIKEPRTENSAHE